MVAISDIFHIIADFGDKVNKGLNNKEINKMTKKQANIKDFARSLKLQMDVNYADRNPSMINDSWQANHYKLTFKKDGKQFSTFFSQGLGISEEPKMVGVLECLQSDCQSTEYSFDEFCGEFGYDQDSIKALKTYKACGKIKDKVHKFFGADYFRFIKAEKE
jgi:glucan biosynthesis protein